MELCSGLAGTGTIGNGNRVFKRTVSILSLEGHRSHIVSFNLLIESTVRHFYRIGVGSIIGTRGEKLEEIPRDQHDDDDNDRTHKQRGPAVPWPSTVVAIAAVIVRTRRSTRARIVRVVLIHIYSLSIHWFRPAFFFCLGASNGRFRTEKSI